MGLKRLFGGNRPQTIALVARASKKVDHRAKARDLYDSTLFKISMAYAQNLQANKTFILSAKYGLLDPDRVITPYNLTLNTMPARDVRKWADGVLRQLQQQADLDRDHFIFPAGDKYRKYLIPHMHSYSIPLEGKRIGEQLQFLKQQVSE